MIKQCSLFLSALKISIKKIFVRSSPLWCCLNRSIAEHEIQLSSLSRTDGNVCFPSFLQMLLLKALCLQPLKALSSLSLPGPSATSWESCPRCPPTSRCVFWGTTGTWASTGSSCPTTSETWSLVWTGNWTLLSVLMLCFLTHNLTQSEPSSALAAYYKKRFAANMSPKKNGFFWNIFCRFNPVGLKVVVFLF